MAKKAELKGVLRLDNAPFVKTIKQSINLARAMARDFARNPISATFAAGAIAARRSLGVTSRIVSQFASGVRTSMIAAGIGIAAAGGAILLFAKNAISAAADLQTFQTSFEVLLGSVDSAKERMGELVKFADLTPFELPEVVAASRSLEVLTHGALSTGKGLTLVGDVAAGTNTRFEETAVTVGRLFDAIRSGRSAGESLMRLQEIGALGGSARTQIEGLMAANRGVEAWRLAQQELQRFSGMMDRQSKTWNGMMSTFHDAVRGAMRQFGAPLIDALTPSLAFLTNVVSGLGPKMAAAGTSFSDAIKTGIDFVHGVFDDPSALITPLGSSLKAAFMEAGNVFVAAMRTAINIVAGSGFFSGLATGFFGLSQVAAGYLISSFQKAISYLIAGIEKGIDMMKSSFYINAFGVPTLRLPGSGGASISDRAKAIMARDEVGTMANDSISKGKENIQLATKDLFGNISGAIRDFSVDDIFGATGEFARAKRSVAVTAAKGAASSSGTAASAAVAAVAASAIKSTGLRGSILGHNVPTALSPFTPMLGGGLAPFGPHRPGLMGSMLDVPAKRTTSILSLRERREIENSQVAELQGIGIRNARAGSTPLAYGAVRRGDRARAREVEKEKLREKMGLDKTNEILKAIQTRFDSLVK